MTNRAVVLLGSNINKEKNLPAAVRLLRQMAEVLAVSSVYETAAVGGGRPETDRGARQPNFFNAAVLVETPLGAADFKQHVLAQIEARLRRVRTADPNAPRTIDADLVLFNDQVFDLDERHHIPDPDLLRFAHAAGPVAELLPEMAHPETGEPLREIATRLLAVSEKKPQITQI